MSTHESAASDALICAARECGHAAIWSSQALLQGATFDFPVCREHGQLLAPSCGVRSLEWIGGTYINDALRSLDPVLRSRADASAQGESRG